MNDNAVAVVCRAISTDDFQAKIRQALPPNVSADRFTRTALTAIQMNPAVCDADRMSLYNSVVRAAADGLMPDGREGALVIFNSREGKKAQWMPMVQGVIKRLAQANITIDAQLVHENDEFDQTFGDAATITHKPPKLGQPRGEIIGAYAIAHLPNGLVMREVMSVDDINQVRDVSRSKDGGPWKQWYGEMARKTVLRRLSKRLPILDPAVVATVQADDELYDLEPAKDEAVVAEQPAAAPEPPPAGKRRPRALQAVVEAPAPAPEPPPPPHADEFDGDVL